MTVITNDVAEATKRAVLYLRVSSRGQVETSLESDGLSLPAQREACERKADGLGASVEACFVERGESATSTTKREALRAMLERLKAGGIDYVIVHKLDRLARNRADDVQIVAAIRAAGAQLVSVSENVDETPSGLLLHGIMSSIAEFYSQNLASEILKGSTQKAKQGGTPFRAPIGYVNSRVWIGEDGQPTTAGLGREVRTIAVDPIRSPLVQEAFRLYATGNYSLSDLGAILEDRGLRTRATRKAPSQVLGTNRLSSMLRNPYYVGIVRYDGKSYAGRHEPLVDEATFEQVQTTLASQRHSGERSYKHDHHLSGSVFCADCESRLIYSRTRGSNDKYYEYFFCLGRKHGTCGQPNHRVEAVVDAVERYWATVTLSASRRDRIRAGTRARAAVLGGRLAVEMERIQRTLAGLKVQEKKLLQAHYADQISAELFDEEQTRIRRERIVAEKSIEHAGVEAARVEEGLEAALMLTVNAQAAYLVASKQERRLRNQAVFRRLEIDREEVARGVPLLPFSQFGLGEDSWGSEAAEGEGAGNENSDPLSEVAVSNFNAMVGDEGFEPPTPSV